MDEQEQADRMAAAEALFMISNRGNKGKADGATRRSKRGRKKKEILDYCDKVDGIHTDTSEDELKFKKGKRGQPTNDNNVTKSSGDSRAAKVRTIGKKFNKNMSDNDTTDPSSHSKISRPTPKKKFKTKVDISPSNVNVGGLLITNQHEIQVEESSSSKPNKKLNRGKLSKVVNETMGAERPQAGMEAKPLGFTGVPLTPFPSKLARQVKSASPRRIPSTNAEIQLKSTDSESLPSSINLLSMNASMPEAVSLPSLPAGIGSLQLSSTPVPNLSSLVETKRGDTSSNDREEAQKQLPLKKRKLLGAAQVEEEKAVEDISDPEEDVGVPSQMQATFTVQAPPMITMQTLMDIKTALTPDEDGDLPLHIAVVHENMRMVTKLINLMRIAVKGVDKFNKQQQTPLHLAVKLNFVPAVDLLMLSGGNINTVDWTGSSGIHMAVQGGFYECLELILKRCPKAEINARNFEGLSPLHLAVTNRDMKQVQLLLKFGADIDLLDGKSGRTALFHAAESNQKNLVELLLKQGANPDLTNYAGVTATMAAQGRNLHSILKLIGSVVQDKQDNKWSSVKGQSGSVMVELNPGNDVIDGTTLVVGTTSTTGGDISSSGLLQQQHSVSSSSLLRQGLGSGADDSSDIKAGMHQNVVVISEPLRIRSVEVSSSRTKSLPNVSPRYPPEIKIETDKMNSNDRTGSPLGSSQGFITTKIPPSSSPSLSSIPVVKVKQEVKDNSPDDGRVISSSPSLLSSTMNNNKTVLISKSNGDPVSIAAIGLSGKPIMRGDLLNNNATSSANRTKKQQPAKLSVPSPRRLSSSPLSSSPLSSFKPVSPHSPSPSNASSSSITSSTVVTASNTDTIALTSKQARVYKRLLEMYNINPALPLSTSGQTGGLMQASPPVLRSLPILPSSLSTRPSSATLSNRTSPSMTSTSLSSPPLSPSPSSAMPLKLSSHNRTAFNPQERRPSQSHINTPPLLQRSLSTQETSTTSPRFLPPATATDKLLTPPQRVSILRVSDTNAVSFKTTFTDSHNLPQEEIRHQHHPQSHTHTYSLHQHPKTQQIHRIATMDMPLNLSAKNYSSSSSPTSYCDNEDKNKINNEISSRKHPRKKPFSSTIQDGDIKPNKEEETKASLVVPEFPHITKSVSPKTASFVRTFLSQQKQHLQHHLNHPTSNIHGVRSSSDDTTAINSSSVSPPSSIVDAKPPPMTLKSINIPPLITSSSSSSLLTHLPLRQSSSLPTSPSSAVSTLSLPLSQLDPKKCLSLGKHGVVTINPSTLSIATSSSGKVNPNFLHKAGGVIDLSVGDEQHRGVVNVLQSFSSNNLVRSSRNDQDGSLHQDGKNMEGKMVGFSGAIISIPSSTSSISSSSSSSLSSSSLYPTMEKSNTGNDNNRVSENSKLDKSSSTMSALTTTTTTATTTATVKERGKRKGRKAGGGGGAGGGAKSDKTTPSSTDVPVQNKINSETDQRLKKFLGMKRSEQGNSNNNAGGATPLSCGGDPTTVNKEATSNDTRTRVESSSSGSNDSTSHNHIDNDNNNRPQTSQSSVPSDRLSGQEPTIETVGIFSGSIQHVKLKSAPLKSLPLSTSSTPKANSTVNRKPIASHTHNAVSTTIAASDANLPSSLTLSSWPLSSKQISSSPPVNLKHGKNKKSQKVFCENAVDGNNANTTPPSTFTINDGDKDVYYSERIVWRSSPLLSMPSSPSSLVSEKQEIKKTSKKSQKMKDEKAGNMSVSGLPVVGSSVTTGQEVFCVLKDSVDAGDSGRSTVDKVVKAEACQLQGGKLKKGRKKDSYNIQTGPMGSSDDRGLNSGGSVQEDVRVGMSAESGGRKQSSRGVSVSGSDEGDKSRNKRAREVKDEKTDSIAVGSQPGVKGDWKTKCDSQVKAGDGDVVVDDSGGGGSGGTRKLENPGERIPDSCEKTNLSCDDSSVDNSSVTVVHRVGSSSSDDSVGFRDRSDSVSCDIDAVVDTRSSADGGCGIGDVDGDGGGAGGVSEPSRMSVEEEQELIIDLGTPNDSKSFVTTST